MSALGHKQTFALQMVMSALPPKADISVARQEIIATPPHTAVMGLRLPLTET